MEVKAAALGTWRQAFMATALPWRGDRTAGSSGIIRVLMWSYWTAVSWLGSLMID